MKTYKQKSEYSQICGYLVAVKAEIKEIAVKKQAAIDKAEGFLKELGL